MVAAISSALKMAGVMAWEILWALVLGFVTSGAIQALVSHSEMARLLPDDRPRSIIRASLLGAASSSCSYAAVAIARSIFRKGGNFTAARAFQFASTNLVIELGILLAILLGWPIHRGDLDRRRRQDRGARDPDALVRPSQARARG